MDDGFIEIYNALDDVGSQIEGLELSGVQHRIPYDLFRQVGHQQYVSQFTGRI